MWLGAVAGLTIILGAVYMLRLVQKTMFGQKTEFTEHFAGLSFSEKAVLIPLTIMVFWIGMYPNSFLKITEPAIVNLLQIVQK